ncbi:MAG: ABC transporter ATP-binding protein [Clostridiales bacterium]|jgi:ABC-2 type transport system ATP-binding protein|nr:ABC transporter ATP-binding protein [Clostridiales bacterium]
MIRTENLTKLYGKKYGIKDVSFSVNKGEIYGFIGQNGAGKSTAIRTLMNMIYPTGGSAKIDGLDCVRDTKAVKQIVGYVPSEVAYYGGYRAQDIFRYAAGFSDGAAARIDKLCAYFELDPSRPISELSLGNRKKVSIIQALIKNPHLLVLDEPTNGLDPLIQEKLFRLLKEKQEEGMTIFLSSHNLSEVEKYCDRVLIIKDGAVVDVFDLKERRKHGKLRVTYTTADGTTETVSHSGEVNELIKVLSTKNLTALTVATESLEDEFLKYYTSETNEKKEGK